MAQPADAAPVGNLAADFEPATEEQWLALVDKVLGGRPLESLTSRTADGIEVQPLYTEGPDEAATGSPGAAPFTRGFTAAQREAGRWDLRVMVDHPSPGSSELELGATSVLVGGAALASENSFRTAIEGVLAAGAPVVLAPGSGFATTAEWLIAAWSAAGLQDSAVTGGFGADPMGLLAREGRLPQGLDRALADATGLAVMAARRFPRVHTWSVDATPYAEAGGSAAQELAAMLCTAVAYLRSMQAGSMDARAAVSSLEVTLGADVDFFTTIAKLRAARRVFGAMSQACGADPATASPTLVVRTLHRDLTRRDPWVNMLRVTSAAFAAALGGADAIIAAAFDSELGRPSELGRRMARNTQLLLSEESHVGRVIDPPGGSWYVESLTDAIAARAWELFGELERAGGMPAVLLDGTLAERIASVRDERRSDVAARRSPITGVSEFPNLDEQLPEVATTPSGTPLCARDSGSATECEPFAPVRWAEPFEALRDAADARRASAAPSAVAVPRVFLANLGDVATHTARASWAKNFFEAGGIEAASSERGTTQGFHSTEEMVEDFCSDPARIACICSSDATYAELAAPAASALAAAGAERIYLAGRPGELADELRSAGVGQFIHVGVDVLAVLVSAHELLGIAPAVADPTTNQNPTTSERREDER